MVETNVQRAAREEKAPDARYVALPHPANRQERNGAVGRHLLGTAVGEQSVAGEHPGKQVADDHPANNLQDETGRPLWPDRFGKQQAKGGARGGAGDAPKDDGDKHLPDEAGFANSRLSEDAVLKFNARGGQA